MTYRNPSPPPGYIPERNVEIVAVEEKTNYVMIDGIPCYFYNLLQESGVFGSVYSGDEFVILTSEDEASTPVVVKGEPRSPEVEISDGLQNIKIENVTSPKSKKKETRAKGKSKKKKEKRYDSSSSDESRHRSKKSPKSDDSVYEEKQIKTEKIHKHKSKKSPKSDESDYEERKREKIKAENISPKVEKSGAMPDHSNSDIMLYGLYNCDLCKATMNSYGTYQSHIIGKRHLKNVRLQNPAVVVSKAVPLDETMANKYPLPPAGVNRIRIKDKAKIQAVIDGFQFPCPALENLIEIQGLEETNYYCQLCDAACASSSIPSHLQGNRHRLNCLRLFRPDMYEDFLPRKKSEYDRTLIQYLRDYEEDYGRGLITVERDFPGDQALPHASMKHSGTSRYDRPGPSHMPDGDYAKDYAKSAVPDTSKSDFYCKVCDSHMNNPQMWEVHIRGKRHIKNLKKAPGVAPSKTRSVLVPGARAKIMHDLDYVDEPVVGLNEMREIQNPDANGEMYNCFLCGACLTSVDVIDHILSQKHRQKYLEKIKHPEMLLLNDTNIHSSKIGSLIYEICEKVQSERGRGDMEVHVVRSAITSR